MRHAPPPDDLLESLLRAGRSHPRARRRLLDDLMEHPAAAVAGELVARVDRALEGCWERGWQPADLMRLIHRELGKPAAKLLRHALASQAADYAQWGTAVAPEWMGQLTGMGAAPFRDPDRPWPLLIEDPLADVVMSGMEVLSTLRSLPGLPRLLPPPSRWPDSAPRKSPDPGRLDPGLLAKIRALLAKAESTEFGAEAETFTAKAQELMTRHRIDRATLHFDAAPDGETMGRRLGVDPPYAQAKYLLLDGIARANGSRAVWSKGFGFATVFGYAEDLEAVEELYTSLLVQATSALQREGRQYRGAARPGDTRRYRRSFLIGFAYRIGERLQEANDDTVRTVAEETGRDLVPILDSRERAAEQALRAAHSHVRSMSLSVSDGEGYRAGTREADAADLRLRPDAMAGGSSRLPR